MELIDRGDSTLFLEALKKICLESQWTRNEVFIDALDNNENDWDTTDEEYEESEDKGSVKSEVNDKEVNGHNNSDTNMEGSDSGDDDDDEDDDGVDDDDDDGKKMDTQQREIKWKNFSSDSEGDDN